MPNLKKLSKHKSWYSVENKGEDKAEIFIYDEIGIFGVEPESFIKDLKNVKAKNIDLRIHSPGGSVFDGVAIMSAIQQHPAKVTAYIDGIAASMAVSIALAANQIKMPSNAWLMIHRASGVAFGNAEDLRKRADLLEKLEANMVDLYEAKAKDKEKYDWRNMMAEETWITGKEAFEMGWVNELLDEVEVAACFEGDFNFKNMPDIEKIENKEKEPIVSDDYKVIENMVYIVETINALDDGLENKEA